MLNRRSRFLVSFVLILTLVLTACAGGGSGDATQQVPATGNTPTVGTGGAGDMTGTPAGGEMAETPTVGAETTGTPAAGDTMGTPAGTDTSGTPEADTTGTPQAGAGGAGTWQGEQIGGTVSVLAIWGGAELDNFMAMIEPFEEQTGITVEYEGTRDLGAVLNTRISGGNPPDVAGVPNPGQLVAMANSGALKPLDDVLDMNAMQEQYDQGFLDLARVDGQLYGIFTKAAVKSLVWYNPKAFEAAGYEVPETWDDLKALEQQIIEDGKTPWCVGIDGGGGSGWPGTDWVEDIMLRTAGPDVYNQWWNHEIPWTDESVRAAFETWGEIVGNEQMVFGGPQNVIATNFGQAFNPMFEEDPSCYLHRQANFITAFFTEQFPDLVAGEDYNFFVFPPINEEHGNPLLVAGDLFGMFNDTPQARALMEYLVTADAQSIWAARGGFLSANKSVDPAVYPDELTGQLGAMLAEADAVRFDASDLMPEGVNSAFSTGVLQFVSAPDQLDAVLEQIEGVAAGAYQEQGQ